MPQGLVFCLALQDRRTGCFNSPGLSLFVHPMGKKLNNIELLATVTFQVSLQTVTILLVNISNISQKMMQFKALGGINFSLQVQIHCTLAMQEPGACSCISDAQLRSCRFLTFVPENETLKSEKRTALSL